MKDDTTGTTNHSGIEHQEDPWQTIERALGQLDTIYKTYDHDRDTRETEAALHRLRINEAVFGNSH